jgi:hypothetical protein
MGPVLETAFESVIRLDSILRAVQADPRYALLAEGTRAQIDANVTADTGPGFVAAQKDSGAMLRQEFSDIVAGLRRLAKF